MEGPAQVIPALFSLVTETAEANAGSGAMDALKIVAGAIIILYGLKRLGDIKDIMIIIGIGLIAVFLFVVLPDLQTNPLYQPILDIVENLPQLINEILGKVSGGT